jgi:hypothetical protein
MNAFHIIGAREVHSNQIQLCSMCVSEKKDGRTDRMTRMTTGEEKEGRKKKTKKIRSTPGNGAAFLLGIAICGVDRVGVGPLGVVMCVDEGGGCAVDG